MELESCLLFLLEMEQFSMYYHAETETAGILLWHFSLNVTTDALQRLAEKSK